MSRAGCNWLCIRQHTELGWIQFANAHAVTTHHKADLQIYHYTNTYPFLHLPFSHLIEYTTSCGVHCHNQHAPHTTTTCIYSLSHVMSSWKDTVLLTHIISLEPGRLSAVSTDCSLTSNTSNSSGTLQQSEYIQMYTQCIQYKCTTTHRHYTQYSNVVYVYHQWLTRDYSSDLQGTTAVGVLDIE